MRYILLPVLLTCLTSCFLGKMEQIAQETKDEVKKSNVAIGESKDSTLLLHYKGVLSNRSAPEEDRIDAAAKLVLKLPNESLASTFSLPQVVATDTAFERIYGSLTFNLKNVVYFQRKTLPDDFDLRIYPVDFDTFRVFFKGAIKAVDLTRAFCTDPSKPNDEKRKWAIRLAFMVPAILGGADLETFQEGGGKNEDERKKNPALRLMKNEPSSQSLVAARARSVKRFIEESTYHFPLATVKILSEDIPRLCGMLEEEICVLEKNMEVRMGYKTPGAGHCGRRR